MGQDKSRVGFHLWLSNNCFRIVLNNIYVHHANTAYLYLHTQKLIKRFETSSGCPALQLPRSYPFLVGEKDGFKQPHFLNFT